MSGQQADFDKHVAKGHHQRVLLAEVRLNEETALRNSGSDTGLVVQLRVVLKVRLLHRFARE